MSLPRFELAREVVISTGKYLVQVQHENNHQGSLKSDLTLVTDADQNADAQIQKMIKEHYPDDGILSEEASTLYPNNEYVWVIDPLDGTVNYSRDLGYWGVSLAILKEGRPEFAALYFPTTDELLTASRGKGAEINTQSLLVSPDFDEDLFPIFLHCSRAHQRYKINLPYKKRSLGVAAYHLCLVAKNTAVLALESTVRLWDFAAAWLIIKEAGGLVECFEGEQPFPTHPGSDYRDRPFPIIAAISPEVMNRAKEHITRK